MTSRTGTGLAQDALAGVKHSSTLARFARALMAGVLFADRLTGDDVEAVAAGAGRPDGLQRSQGVVGAFAAPGDAPELVIGQE